MYIFAHLLLPAAFLTAIFLAASAIIQLWQSKSTVLPYVEKGCLAIAVFMSASSMILLTALAGNDFSLTYVARYTDRLLPLFYRLTAFWAGQEGSWLFWGWSTAIFGVLFIFSKAYTCLKAETKLRFWIFFLLIMSFFLLLSTVWNNPFIVFAHPPADGKGLNPLLQHAGMIFHPPLLFIGYAGFTIPACLALAQASSSKSSGKQSAEGLWSVLTRPFTLTAWALLSAGIILGAWWAYMELDWNGYWGWDPVENASLLPWLISTAFLHTSPAEIKRGNFKRLNVLLMALTTISAFMATYITRSGTIQSLHAYSDAGINPALLLFIAAFLLAAIVISLRSRFKTDRPVGPDSCSDRESPEDFLALVSALLLMLAFIILCATCWPLLSKLWSDVPTGILPAFYNRVCLPLFTMLTLFLAYYPWRSGKAVAIPTGIFILGIPVCWYLMEGEAASIHQPLAWIAASAAFTGILGIVLRCRARLSRRVTHIGLLLMVLGIAFSGPYQLAGNFALSIGQTRSLGPYSITLKDIYKGENAAYSFYQAELDISRNGEQTGTLFTERRKYFKYAKAFSKADSLFTLGSEAYASLLGINEKNTTARLHLSINPQINWIWIGGFLLCLCPLLQLLLSRKHRG